MAGGLIQLVTSGRQDTALTIDPQITFFKKIYRRHTNFALELKEIYTNQEPDWEDKISFTLENGDLIHKCFIQIELPKLSFTDSLINNTIYLSWKADMIDTFTNEMNKWNSYYINLKNYVSIELLLYQQLETLFLSDNISLNDIKEIVNRFNTTYFVQKNLYINFVDIIIYNKINISGYLLSINKLLTYDNTIINNNYITLDSIKIELKKKVDTMYEYLIYYHSNWKHSQEKVNNVASNKINFAWTEYLAHFYFSQFELEIGGQMIEEYSSDQLHIYQTHHLMEDHKKNYNEMIGNIDELNNFNNIEKPSKIIYCPLLFWFCKDPGSALPLVAMRNTTININLTLNKIKNVLYFQDWEDEYNKLIILTILKDITINTKLSYSKYTYDNDSKQITYYLNYINDEALTLIYPNLKPDDILFILNTFGSNNKLELIEWINFKNNLINYPTISNKIGGYNSFIDYNILYSLLPKPKIKLLVENIYLDDLERQKFASSKLEYIIETFQENIFDVNNLPLFDGTITINRPNKYLKWFIQPKIFLYGLSEYGKVYNCTYEFSKYFTNPIFNKQIITLNQIELLNTQLDSSFYNYVNSFKNLNSEIPSGIYFYSFSLFPEEPQPSGTINLSVIKEKKIRYEMNMNFLKEYFNSLLNKNNINLQAKILSTSYNFFIIHNGIGRLLFAN